MQIARGAYRILLASALPSDGRAIGAAVRSVAWHFDWVSRCDQLPAALRAFRPHLLFVSRVLPDGDCKKALWASWDLLEPPPLIVIGACTSLRTARRSAALGMDRVLERPLDSFSVLRALAHWERRQNPPF